MVERHWRARSAPAKLRTVLAAPAGAVWPRRGVRAAEGDGLENR